MNRVSNLSYFCGYDQVRALGILPLSFFGVHTLQFFTSATLCFLWENCANYRIPIFVRHEKNN
ncbi:MAG: hypothetical protein RL632_1083 [Bacteroidota bacterium]